MGRGNLAPPEICCQIYGVTLGSQYTAPYEKLTNKLATFVVYVWVSQDLYRKRRGVTDVHMKAPQILEALYGYKVSRLQLEMAQGLRLTHKVICRFVCMAREAANRN